MKKIYLLLAVLVSAFALSGCWGNHTTDTKITGVLVDPYVKGATLHEHPLGEIDNNPYYEYSETKEMAEFTKKHPEKKSDPDILNQQLKSESNLAAVDRKYKSKADQTGDPLPKYSTPTTDEGNYTFDKPLTPGNTVTTNPPGAPVGTHDGKKFDIPLSAVVDENGTVPVVSPVTTLNAKGMTPEMIQDMITKAVTKAISPYLSDFVTEVDHLLTNPLGGGLMKKTLSEISSADFSLIQANIATYGLLKIMSSSSALSALRGTQIQDSMLVQEIYTRTFRIVSEALSIAQFTTLNTTLDGLRTAIGAELPEAKVSLIIRTASKAMVTVAEKVYDTYLSTPGSDETKIKAGLTAGMTLGVEITKNLAELVTKLYGIEYREELSALLPAQLSRIQIGAPKLYEAIKSEKNNASFTPAGEVEFFNSYTKELRVGFDAVILRDTQREVNITAVLFYPAVLGGIGSAIVDGKYPLIVFAHGYQQKYSDYHDLWETLVPQGYVMAFITTQQGITIDTDEYAKDITFLLKNLKADSVDSIIKGHITAKSALMGHSTGGGSIYLSHNTSPQADTIVSLAALGKVYGTITGSNAIDIAANLTIPSLILSGEKDCITPVAEQQQPLYNNLSSLTKNMKIINGGDHCGFSDSFNCPIAETVSCGLSGQGDTISEDAQIKLALKYITDWLGIYLK